VISELGAPIIGLRVARGPQWCWGDQDGGRLGMTVERGSATEGWVGVRWDNGNENNYRNLELLGDFFSCLGEIFESIFLVVMFTFSIFFFNIWWIFDGRFRYIINYDNIFSMLWWYFFPNMN
jgi:hypothetical protein